MQVLRHACRRHFHPKSFRSLCSASAETPKRPHIVLDVTEPGGIARYGHAPALDRPSLIEWSPSLCNSVSFIGSVDYPPKVCTTKNGAFGVHTVLSIHSSSCLSPRKPRIGLRMWDEMAETSLKHLKPDDFIYVSGRLKSYEEPDKNGKLMTYYSVNVKELNFVERPSDAISGQSRLEKRNSCLRLWQVFLVSPHEWWDNRKNKKNPKSPDFKHKDTKEALWISPDDPPWLKKQLQLYDSRMAEHGYGCKSSHSGLTLLEL